MDVSIDNFKEYTVSQLAACKDIGQHIQGTLDGN